MTWQCSCHVFRASAAPSILSHLVHPLSSLPVELVHMNRFQKTIYRFSTLVTRHVEKNRKNDTMSKNIAILFIVNFLLLLYWLYFFSIHFWIKLKKNLKISWDQRFRFAKLESEKSANFFMKFRNFRNSRNTFFFLFFLVIEIIFHCFNYSLFKFQECLIINNGKKFRDS